MSIQEVDLNVLNSSLFSSHASNSINESTGDKYVLSQQLKEAKEMGYSDSEIFSALDMTNSTHKNKVPF